MNMETSMKGHKLYINSPSSHGPTRKKFHCVLNREHVDNNIVYLLETLQRNWFTYHDARTQVRVVVTSRIITRRRGRSNLGKIIHHVKLLAMRNNNIRCYVLVSRYGLHKRTNESNDDTKCQ